MVEIQEKENGFYIGDDPNNPTAEVTYHVYDEQTLVIDHTYVSDTMRGKGVGGKLVHKVAEHARKEQKEIIPQCSFAHRVMLHNPDYQDVLSPIELSAACKL